MGRPILSRNLHSHLKTECHLGAWNDKLERQERCQEELDQLSAYDAKGLQLADPGPISVSTCPTMFEPDSDIMTDDPPTQIMSDLELIQQLGEEAQPTIPADDVRSQIAIQFERLLQDNIESRLTHDGVDHPFVADDLPVGAQDDKDEPECFDFSLLADSKYFPYPNKLVSHSENTPSNVANHSVQIMLLDVLDNLPQCCFTNDQIALILNLLKQVGVGDVPSLKTFRRVQKQMQGEYGNKPQKFTSHLGNIFHMNTSHKHLPATWPTHWLRHICDSIPR
jgi:hypothetical protein